MTTQTEPTVDDYKAVLKALVDRLDYIFASGEYRSVWDLAHAHGHRYTGPQLTYELQAAKRLLGQSDIRP